MTVLAAHVGHHCEPLDDRRLRCHTCTHTLLLPDRAGPTSSTSNSPIPGKDDPRCPTHPTEHANACRTCAADRKAAPDADQQHGHHDPDWQPTADVAARVAEARAQLRTSTPRTDTTRPPALPYDDPERMAAARAEVAARQPIPLPEPAPEGAPS